MTQQGVIFVGGKGGQLTLPNPHFSRLRFSREATFHRKEGYGRTDLWVNGLPAGESQTEQ
jgi:hypothetical protein